MTWSLATPGGIGRSSMLAAVAALTLSIFFGLTLDASAQEAKDRHTGTPDVRTEGSQTLSDLPGTLAEKYPTVRALVLARGDCPVFEYYRNNISAETRSQVYSVTKSVLSILVGIAIDDGYLRLDEKLSEIFPEAFDKNVDPLARNIRVRDLLTKTAGFAEAGEGDFRIGSPTSGLWQWMLNRPVKYPAGTHFRYDGIGSDLLSVLLSRAIKQNAGNFAQQKLLDPLQITNYDWISDTEGHLHGEDGLSLTARDMAKIGMLYLRDGRWGDRQIVSDTFVRDSTTRQNDGGPPVNAGYGYHWWISKTNLDAFFAAGIKSQLIYVAPKLDLVVAVSADSSVRGGSQRFVDDVVMPAAASLSGTAPCIADLRQGHPE
jgi:CubicO group peptidase (beta-lactamase class C family)